MHGSPASPVSASKAAAGGRQGRRRTLPHPKLVESFERLAALHRCASGVTILRALALAAGLNESTNAHCYAEPAATASSRRVASSGGCPKPCVAAARRCAPPPAPQSSCRRCMEPARRALEAHSQLSCTRCGSGARAAYWPMLGGGARGSSPAPHRRHQQPLQQALRLASSLTPQSLLRLLYQPTTLHPWTACRRASLPSRQGQRRRQPQHQRI